MQIEIPEQHLEGRDNCPNVMNVLQNGLLLLFYFIFFYFFFALNQNGPDNLARRVQNCSKGKVSILGNLPSVQTMPGTAGSRPPLSFLAKKVPMVMAGTVPDPLVTMTMVNTRRKVY